LKSKLKNLAIEAYQGASIHHASAVLSFGFVICISPLLLYRYMHNLTRPTSCHQRDDPYRIQILLHLQLRLSLTKWLGNRQAASKSQILGDRRWFYSSDSHIQIDPAPDILSIV